MRAAQMLAFVAIAGSTRAALRHKRSLTTDWIAPLDDQERLRSLCTDNNHFESTRGRQSPLVSK